MYGDAAENGHISICLQMKQQQHFPKGRKLPWPHEVHEWTEPAWVVGSQGQFTFICDDSNQTSNIAEVKESVR